MTTVRPKAWKRGVFGGLLLLMILIVASELYLRHLGLGRSALVMPDPAAGYILAPNQDLHRFGGETRTNSYGMRSDPVPATKQPGVFRILVVGDSYVYGSTSLDQSQIFAELLHRELPKILHRPVEVLNASAGNWAISNELGFIRSRGIFNADLVLLVLNWGDQTQTFSPYQPYGIPNVDHHPEFALQELWERYLKSRIFPPPHEVNKQSSAADAMAAKQNLAYLDQFLATVVAGGAKMALVYIPLPRETSSHPSGLIQWCAANHVPMIDLTSTASRWATIPDILLRDRVHYNAKGNRLIADELEKDWPEVMQTAAEAPDGPSKERTHAQK